MKDYLVKIFNTSQLQFIFFFWIFLSFILNWQINVDNLKLDKPLVDSDILFKQILINRKLRVLRNFNDFFFFLNLQT